MTLTKQQKAEGWIEHDGGPCPVPLETLVIVLFRDGFVADDIAPAIVWTVEGYGNEDFWQHKPSAPSADIIAYRPEPKP